MTRTVLLACALLNVGCGAVVRRASHLTEAVVTNDGTVFWADYRAAAHGDNDVHVTMCRPGQRPVCVRFRPEPGRAR